MGRDEVILLDTHTWVWWRTKPEKLGRKAKQILARSDRRAIAAISVWEVAMKAQISKLRFDSPVDVWVQRALQVDPVVEVLPLLPTISVAAAGLAWRHGDPADRIIVATALAYNTTLVTADEAMHDCGLVKCVWD